MAKNLVIVESPAKVKTIKKFLGSNYDVTASMGHVRDLPKSQMGIDVEHDFEPKYITIRGKGDLLATLRKQVKKADRIYLATDPDREGEAISWHLMSALKLNEGETDKSVQRITFNEITKNAVKRSLKEPRQLNMNLVDAQQARRILDRLVGYDISPLLWAKVKRGLSAGRVQSVALRIICDREEEIEDFIPEEYWTIEAALSVKGEKKKLNARFYGTLEGKKEVRTKAEADEILKFCRDAEYRVSEVKKGERIRKAPLPFTTSTMQQEASKVLNFSTQKTMRVAQQLYEGVDIKGQGTVGLISYLRTDSTRISDEAAASARDFISKEYGEQYLSAEKTEGRKEKPNVQDAHEAIRPTDLNLKPAQIRSSLTNEQFKLYQLIFKRFLASRMANAVYETTAVRIEAGGRYLFTVSASKVSFDGFLSVYSDGEDEEGARNVLSGNISEKSVLSDPVVDGKQHFTQPPAHYTEASLVRALEELGIGRPSTYAPTITTLLARRYITKEGKNLFVTEMGNAVNGIMKEAFPEIVDEQFTATMESLLDGVEEGNVQWKTVIRNFYPDLEEAVKRAEKEIEEVKIADEETDVICENCGRNMVVKYGPHGKFLACPGFPDCHNTKPYYEKIGVACPSCGKDIVMRMSKKGRRYYGCIGFPDCSFMSWAKPTDRKCPKCGSMMVEKGKHLSCTNEECRYVEKNGKSAEQSAGSV
ncbi:MAG: type I DNA topoisomerase [Lachnospiraceae bacterium]|nr:type I DNA topoisomerase [Lachnospiraceae bacterium]